MRATGKAFLPREHGATAMLLTPFAAAAVLARVVRWQEVAALVAVVAAFAAKDPLVVLARQRNVWKQPHPETRAAARWAAAEATVAALCGLALAASGPLVPYAVLVCGAIVFSVLAVWANVQNRQRSTIFQMASAVALTSTSLVAALAATGTIPPWCWWLWLLLAVQAVAGIFTVHARLDARVAARKDGSKESSDKIGSRQLAVVCSGLLALGGVTIAMAERYWIGGALLFVAAVYAAELRRQLNPQALQTPLTKIGLQMLSTSLIYAAVVVVGLW